jgi:hypothetical protein
MGKEGEGSKVQSKCVKKNERVKIVSKLLVAENYQIKSL